MTTRWPSFDELKQLAEHSPEKLEQLRSDEIERVIARAPETMKRRLRGLQFQIDCQRRLHKNPLASCIAISRMMRDSLQQLNAALQGDMESPVEFRQPGLDRTAVGKVLPFAVS